MIANTSMRSRPAIRVLGAAGAYFAVVFGLGFGLGVARVLVTAPRLGEVPAVLLELPVMLAASWFASRWCAGLFGVPARAPERLAMGFVAFDLVLLAEGALSVLAFGRTVAQHLETYTHWAGGLGLAAQLLFALMPWAQARRR